MIRVTDIKKTYKTKTLFEHLSFSFSSGLLYIHGKSGCGKSTLLKIMMSLEEVDCGQITYSKENLLFSYYSQGATLFDELSLKENIKELNDDIDINRYKKLKRLLTFYEEDKRLISLSGGERQKAEIIYTLSRKADIYVLDEPFSSLDEESKKKLVSFLNEFSKDHPVILVNHDVTLKDLRIDMAIDFTSDGIKVLSDQINDDKFTKKILSNNTKLAFKTYFSKQKWYCAIKMVFALITLIFFALGTSTITTKSPVEKTSITLRNDPFDAHAVRFSNLKKPVDSSFFAEDNTGIEYLSLYDKNTSKEIILYGCSQSEECQYYTNDTTKLLTGKDNIYIDDKSYSIKMIEDKTDFEGKLPFVSKFFRLLIDDLKIRHVLLCPRSLIDDLLLQCPSKAVFDASNISFANPRGISVSVGEGKLYDYATDITANKIVDSPDYIFEVPEISKGVEIQYYGNEAKLVTTAETTENRISLSLPTLKFLYMIGSGYEREESIFGYEFKDKDLIDVIKAYDKDILPFDVNYFVTDMIERQSIVYFSLSAGSLLCFIFIICFTSKTKRKQYQNLVNIYDSNQISRSSLNKGLLFAIVLEQLVVFLISFLLYIFAFIPISNFNLMKALFVKPNGGYYYYSQQPLNPYYDNIKSPMKIFSFDPIIFILIVITLLFAIVQVVSIRKQKDVKK